MPGKRQSRGVYLLKSGQYCARVSVFGREVSQTFSTARQAKTWREHMKFNAGRAPKNLTYFPHKWIAHVEVRGRRIEVESSNYEDAFAWLEDAQSRISHGLPLDASGESASFDTFTQDWRGPNGTASLRTRADYEYLIRTYLSPFFSGMKLLAIDASTVRDWTKFMEDNGKPKATIVRVRALLKQIMRTAYSEGEVLTDIFAGSRNPKVARNRSKPLTEKELELFISNVSEHKLMVMLHYSAGLRPSELRALRVKDFNLDEGQMTVSAAWRTDKKTWEIGPTKTGLTRVIPIHPSLSPMLKDAISGLDKEDFLFRHNDGRLISDEYYRKQIIGKASAKAGLPWVTPYTLRHTYASHLISVYGMAPTYVGDLMGHSTPVETMRTYAHGVGGDVASYVGRLLPFLDAESE